MKRRRALSVGACAALFGIGEAAIWKAIRQRKLHVFHIVGFNEKTASRLVDFDEVSTIWRRAAVDYEERIRKLEVRSFVIMMPNKSELLVLGGVWTELCL